MLCALKWVFLQYFFASDIDIGFGSGDGGGFQLGVEDDFFSDNGISVDEYIKGKVDVGICDSVGWGWVGRDDIEEAQLGVEDEVDSKKESIFGKGVKYELSVEFVCSVCVMELAEIFMVCEVHSTMISLGYRVSDITGNSQAQKFDKAQK